MYSVYVIEYCIGIFISTYFIYQTSLYLGRDNERVILSIIGLILGIMLAIWSLSYILYLSQRNNV